jgi:hypothetical protein
VLTRTRTGRASEGLGRGSATGRDVEVDQETQLEPGGAEVGEDLGAVDREIALDRLELDDDLGADDQVGDEFADVLAAVREADGDLGDERDAAEAQLGFECPLIGVLEHAGPEPAMHLDGRADDRMRELLVDDRPTAQRLLESSLERVVTVRACLVVALVAAPVAALVDALVATLVAALVAAPVAMVGVAGGGLGCVVLGCLGLDHRGAPFSP